MTVSKAMELNVEQRYQKPVEMMLDLQKAIKDLKKAAEHGDSDEDAAEHGEDDRTRTVLLVETNTTIQDALRSGLTKRGYRVLVIGDPERAFERLTDLHSDVEGTIISTATLGQPALALLGRMGTHPKTKNLPTILLLGKTQTAAKDQLTLAESQVALCMPITMSELSAALQHLLGESARSDAAS